VIFAAALGKARSAHRLTSSFSRKVIAGAIWLARQSHTGAQLRESLAARYGYNLDESLEVLIERNEYTTEALQTVPVALVCATHATSWEHAIDLAARIGGDTDTIACMAGGIAEARFGLPASVVTRTRSYLTKDMALVVDAAYARIGRNPSIE
jgi:ADP-ribosylglycohydrolase